MAPEACPDRRKNVRALRHLGVWIAALVVAPCLAGCGETSLLIVIDGDFFVPTELDTVELLVMADGDEVFDEFFSLTATEPLPQSLTLLPGSYLDADLEISAVGRLGGTTGAEVAQGNARARFSEGEQVRVEVMIATLCGGVQCSPWEYCVENVCEGRPCDDNDDCDDGDPCNGLEICNGGACEQSASPPCDDHDPCTIDICLDDAATCEHEPIDADEDGQSPAECGGTDCDDENALVGEGFTEVCDGFDNDCNETVDDGFECALGQEEACTTPCETTGAIVCEEGCIWSECQPPPDICNDLDDDCDGLIDEGLEVNPTGGRRLSNGADTSQSASLAMVESAEGATFFGLAWSDARHGDSEIYFVLLDDTASPISSELRVTDAPGSSDAPSLIWTGAEFLVVWTDARPGGTEIFAQQLSGPPDVATVGEAVQMTETMGNSSEAVVAWTDGFGGMAWIERMSGSRHVRFQLVDALGTPLATAETLSDSGSDAFDPDIAWTGTDFGVVWTDAAAEVGAIFFAPVDATGTRLAAPQLVSDTATGAAQQPSITWAGEQFAVAWSEQSSDTALIVASTLGPDGTPLVGQVPVTSGRAATTPALAWSGGEILVAFTERILEGEILFQRLSAELLPIDSPLRVTNTGTPSNRPDVLGSTEGFVIVWDDRREGENDEIYSAHLVGCSGL